MTTMMIMMMMKKLYKADVTKVNSTIAKVRSFKNFHTWQIIVPIVSRTIVKVNLINIRPESKPIRYLKYQNH